MPVFAGLGVAWQGAAAVAMSHLAEPLPSREGISLEPLFPSQLDEEAGE